MMRSALPQHHNDFLSGIVPTDTCFPRLENEITNQSLESGIMNWDVMASRADKIELPEILA